MNTFPEWRPMCERHLDSVVALSKRLHPELPEDPAVFADKCRLAPEACRVLMLGDSVVGYALAHPWKLYSIPRLNERLSTLPDAPDCLHLHDLALAVEARGVGASTAYLTFAKGLARGAGLGCLAMVSVYGTDVLWARHGFEVCVRSLPAAELAAYGPTAKYMLCRRF